MKSLMPWFCLAAATAAHVNMASAANGVDDYRRGDYIKALQEFSKQAKIDSLEAYYLGQMNLYGYGQLKNNAKAVEYFSRAGEGGFLPAQKIMALYLLLDRNDPTQAFYWFKKAADLNDVQAQMYTAAAYLFGYGVQKNADKARQYYIGAAKQGNSIAQTTLAEHFLDSRQGTNKQMGMIWLNKAVEQHNPKAQLLLGKLYLTGNGVPKSPEQAIKMIDLSVGQSFPMAMIQKGDMAREQNDFNGAKDWYTKAVDLGSYPAELSLGQLYYDEKNPGHDEKLGYLWTLKAAQHNVVDAQLALAEMYKTGKGALANVVLAKEWQKKASDSKSLHPEVQVADWLSNGKSTDFKTIGYKLNGIWADWSNPRSLVQNAYNPPPQMVAVTRDTLYKPHFELTAPNDIAISDYYDALVISLGGGNQEQLTFSPYPMDDDLLALKAALLSNDSAGHDKAQALIAKLQSQASLGDSLSEFDLGQVYQYGMGVQPNIQEAIRNYQLAAGQDNLSAMYALGLLYIEGQDSQALNYSKGIEWLQNAAFKGSSYAQFALAQIYENGFKNKQGELVIKPDPQQADGMYFIAAADGNGMAQYRLAEMLVRKKQTEVSVVAKQARWALIKSLYQGALSNGVMEAALPLAFFNAMDSDKAKQESAFKVAKQEADAGNANAALLLALMYDRGIGVEQSQSDALSWYQKAGKNLVSDFILGTYSSLGVGVAQDKVKGQELLQQSADANFSYANLNLAVLKQEQKQPFIPQLEKALDFGNSKAGLLLADYYLSMASNDNQMKQARDIYQLFATKGDKDAQLKLGYMYETGLGGKADVHNALTWYNMSAEQGQSMAQYMLGRLYQMGYLDAKPDYDLAKQWYSRAQSNYSPAAVALGFVYDTVDDSYAQAQASYAIAAENHSPVGEFNLGLIYEEGKGQPVDLEKARALYQQAADQGHPQAMTRLAGLYFNGINGSSDPQIALEWYQKAAEKGDRDALYQLGLLSETGIATKLDATTALNYYQLSAKLGSQQGMLAAARMLQYGVGVAKDTKQAGSYYEMLAGLGNAFAQYQLASLFNTKELPETTTGEGKKWLQEALKNGSPQATKAWQWLASQNQSSFVEPAMFSLASSERPVELMYMDAINQWNCGDEVRAKLLLNHIRTQFPDYIPAKRACEQLGLVG